MYAQSLIGTVLLGRYRVEDVLGIGGMGVVVRAVHTDLDTQVAIKFLLPNMVESPSVVQRFLREAQATVKLKSAHVAKVIDVGKMPDGAPFMVMEYLSGADLGQVLKAHGAQPPMVACDLMLQVCEGMSEAHAIGIVHRDVKPSNFFVTRNPDGSPLVKILDFGISKVPMTGDMQLTGTQSMVGTPAYMAPEHMRAASRADARSDLWSMGVVLYQLLTNQLPFDGESYADLCLKVAMELPAPIQALLPPGLGEVVLRCLEKDAAQRFQSVAQLAYALAPYCSDPVVASVAAERCARILEAPRGPRAPTLGAGDALIPPTGQLSPYAHPSGHQSHNSHLRSQNSHLRSHPSSLSGGAGELQVGGAKKSRLALYGVGAAVVLVLGVGLGVFAAGDGGETAAPADVTPAAAPAPAAAPVAPPAAPAAPAAPAVEAKADEPPQLQGGIEPEPAAKPDEAPADPASQAKADEPKLADAKPEPSDDKVGAKADAKSDGKAEAKADAKSDGKAEPKAEAKVGAKADAKPKAPKAKPKKKPADLFNSRE